MNVWARLRVQGFGGGVNGHGVNEPFWVNALGNVLGKNPSWVKSRAAKLNEFWVFSIAYMAATRIVAAAVSMLVSI